MVHGDHRVVVQMKCSYCNSGLFEKAALSTKARPQGELAAMIEKKSEEEVLGNGLEDGVAANSAGEVTLGLDDVVNADWSGLDIDPELWQYV